MGKRRRFYDFEVKIAFDKTKLGLSIPRYVMCEEGAEPDVIRAIVGRNGGHAVEGGGGQTLLGIYVRNHSFLVRAGVYVIVRGKIVTPGYQRRKDY